MTPLEFTLLLLAISALAGMLGSMLGLGGGLILVPALTIGLGLDIRYAVGASILSVIATSSGAAAAYVREGLTNLRVAMFLELATTTGAITGARLGAMVASRWLYFGFGLLLAYSALAMWAKRNRSDASVPLDPIADRLKLHGSYFDARQKRDFPYRVAGTGRGLFLMYVAGLASGMLGIGSGALKVPAMDLAMKLPIQVSAATSNFMIGVTAAASAGAHVSRGDVVPFIAAPVAVGVLGGAFAGAKLLRHVPAARLRYAFVAVLALMSLQMFSRSLP